MLKTLICFIVIFMILPLTAQVKIKEKVEIKPEEGNLKSSSSTVIYSNGFINGFVMPKSGMLQVYYAYLSHLDLPLPDCAALRTHFLEGDSTKNDLLVPRFPDLITSPKYINDYCSSTISTRYQYSYNNSSATEEVYLYKAGKVNAGDTVQFSYYSDMIGTGSEFLYGIYDASEIKLSDGTIAGWDIRFGYYDNCIQDFDNVLQISIGIIDPCQIDSCGDDWKPVETITDANFETLDKDNNTYNWTEKKLGTDGKIQTIPHSETVENGCEWQRDSSYIRTGVTFLISSIPMSAEDSSKGGFNILDDADFSVCKGKDWRNKDVWKISFSNIKIPIFCSLCQKPVWQVNYGKEKKYDMECIDIVSGSREEFTNILNSINSLVFLPNNDNIYNYKCDWIRKIYNTLTALQSGNENINFEAPVFSSQGTMVHETNHLIKMKKMITNALNIFDVGLATLKYEAGQCPNEIKDKLKNETLGSLRVELKRVANLYNYDRSNTMEVETEASRTEGEIYKTLISELREFNKSNGCPEL